MKILEFVPSIVAAGLVCGAVAAVSVARSQPAPPQAERNYTISATLLQDLFNYLQERPYKEVAPLIARIQQQVAIQNQPPPPPAEPKGE